jgi:hypothetical protein
MIGVVVIVAQVTMSAAFTAGGQIVDHLVSGNHEASRIA